MSEEELVDIKKVDPTILVELRYAGSKNIAGRPFIRQICRHSLGRVWRNAWLRRRRIFRAIITD